MVAMGAQAITIQEAIKRYLDSVGLARSAKTAESYRYALDMFQKLLFERHLDPATTLIDQLPEDAIAWYAAHLKYYAIATEAMYLTAVKGLYHYLAAENLASPNLPRIRLLVRQRSRRQGQRLPQFPREAIETILDYAKSLPTLPAETPQMHLRDLRDRAFLYTLADTGLRVHEACGLKRGDLDRFEARAIIIGKGDKQAVVRFSRRAMRAIEDYLNERAHLDGTSGKPLASLPLFARHDKGAGKKVKPITTVTGRNIVAQRAREALKPEEAKSVTPHSFRHYFVTTVLRATGNLKMAQELARHQNIAVTQRYAHLSDDELDQGYHEIFDS